MEAMVDRVERLRRAYRAFSSEEFDAALEIVHPEIEFFPPGGQAPRRGAESFRQWMEPDAFSEQVVEPLEFTVSGDKVLVRQRTRARGAGSGIELELDAWAVWTFDDDGLVMRLEGYMLHEEGRAREAAGLSEPGT